MWIRGIIVLFSLMLILKCIVLYVSAKPKHRKEKIPLVFFFGHNFWYTGISFPRAFLPLFEIFQGRFIGFNTIAVRIIVLNNQQQILRCLMSPERQKNPIIWDIGAGGFVQSGICPDEAANMETCEELGFSIRDMDKTSKVTYPCDGFNHVIFHYHVVKDDYQFDPDLTDRTYTRTTWASVQDVLSNSEKYKHDPLIFVRKYMSQ